eukprot:TRINITY_DN63208_c0_g1_i1.p1 TRINITY_DN63208_c0_g1~~TRINITY_DN63208_c0_g1_i1.p1  ORF type:complete len:417 (+),score=49.58 TRINITY_DN63208_c0_g1_i1:177-1427(+)
MARKNSPLWTLMLVLGMLLSGTINTVVMKIQFSLHSVGIEGNDKVFSKPWYGTFNMLLAMALVLVTQQTFNGCQLCRQRTAKSIPLIDNSDVSGHEQKGKSYACKAMLTSIPAFFDLVATVLGCMGVLYIPASIFQMLRASTMVFAAFFSVVCLKRKLIGPNYAGLCLCVVGVCMVSMANLMDGSGTSGDSTKSANSDDEGDSSMFLTLLGIGLTLAGQVVQAAQVIAEEWILKDVDLPPFEIIGYEGFWGILMMLIVGYPLLWVLPGSDVGHVEDPVDTIVMIRNNPYLLLCFLTYLCSCATLNATGIAVTGALSGTMRMMLDALRTLGIWAFFLVVHLVDETSPFGERFTTWSWLQLGGFAVLVVGQAVYGEVLKLPCFRYPRLDDHLMDRFQSPSSAINLASPLPRQQATLDK